MHLYSLRLTGNYWKIPLYCLHECKDICAMNITYNPDDDNFIDIQTNPKYIDGKCEKFETLTPTYIHLSEFNIENPRGHIGKLAFPDLVVVPDKEFTLQISYPLGNPIETRIASDTSYTLRDIIFLIKEIYIEIYKEEEETSSPTLFNITENCRDCAQVQNSEHFQLKTHSDGDIHDCSICYLPMDEQYIELDCKHNFHKECIDSWIRCGRGETCPLCRTRMFSCRVCNDTHIIQRQEEHVVLPPHLRDYHFIRNSTDGVYEIYDYDFEHLLLSGIYYNNIYKQMVITIRTI